jgi:hypothetical protein
MKYPDTIDFSYQYESLFKEFSMIVYTTSNGKDRLSVSVKNLMFD